MQPLPGYGSPYRRPVRRRPNYTARRLVAVAVLVLVIVVLRSLLLAVFGDDDDDGSVAAGSTSTTVVPTTTTALEAPHPCTHADEPSSFSTPADWFRTVVDTEYALPIDYAPPDLVPASAANYSAEYRIREFMAADLNLMRNALLREGLPEVALLAAYRSIDEQADLFSRREAELGRDAALAGTARPGHSEHHLGTAIDVRLIGETDVDETFGDTPTGRWLAEHAWEYGFILSYPKGKEAVTCYKYEPWHFRYVGIELASKIHASGLTLREFLWHWEIVGRQPGESTSATTTSSTAPGASSAAG